jgi:GntR family transcriptional regulator
MASKPLSTRPLYILLRDALADRIADGQLKPGAALASEGDLAREFGVSPGTMRKALDLLESERLITRRQGRGTFVNDQLSDELSQRFMSIRGPDGERILGDLRSYKITAGAVD